MGLGDSLLLTIADKLLIGVILLIAGFWLNERLEKLKGQISLQNSIAQSRASACGVLWKRTESLTPRGEEIPTEEECKDAFECIRKWYYCEAGAMHLSLDATDHCLNLLQALEDREARSAKKHATALRTQLKVDLGVYSKADAKVSLPRPN